MTAERPLCEICGEPMPENEVGFRYHGYSGPCPKPPTPQQSPITGLINDIAAAYLGMYADPARDPMEQCTSTIDGIVRPFVDGFCQENAELRAELEDTRQHNENLLRQLGVFRVGDEPWSAVWARLRGMSQQLATAKSALEAIEARGNHRGPGAAVCVTPTMLAKIAEQTLRQLNSKGGGE